MYIDPTKLTVGQKYVIMMTGVVRPLVAECVDAYDPRYGGTGKLKILNNGDYQDLVLRGEDYIVTAVYDPVEHGLIE